MEEEEVQVIEGGRVVAFKRKLIGDSILRSRKEEDEEWEAEEDEMRMRSKKKMESKRSKIRRGRQGECGRGGECEEER